MKDFNSDDERGFSRPVHFSPGSFFLFSFSDVTERQMTDSKPFSKRTDRREGCVHVCGSGGGRDMSEMHKVRVGQTSDRERNKI